MVDRPRRPTRCLAALLSAALIAVAPGSDGLLLFAQEVVRPVRDGSAGALGSAGGVVSSIGLSPLGLGSAAGGLTLGGTLPSHLETLAPSASLGPLAARGVSDAPLALTVSLGLSRPIARAAQAGVAAKAEPPAVVSGKGFSPMYERLGSPSEVRSLSGAAPADASRGAAEIEFVSRLGGGRAAASSVDATPQVGRSAELAPYAGDAPAPRRAMPAPRPVRPQHRSPIFSGVSAAAVGGLLAIVHFTGASIAANVGFLLLPMVAGYALLEFGSFVRVVTGRKVGEDEFWRQAKRLVAEMDLHSSVQAALIGHMPGKGILRLYKPERRFSFSFGFMYGSRIYLRPELVRTPFLFKLILKHELDHFYTSRERAPPKTWALLRGVGTFWSELRARTSDFWPSNWLRGLRIPALERVLSEVGLSMKLASSFDVLVGTGASGEWDDPKLYARLSDGKARISGMEIGELLGRIADREKNGAYRIKPEHDNRYRAIVAPAALMGVPRYAEPGTQEFRSSSNDARRLLLAIKQLDDLRQASKLLMRTQGEDVTPAMWSNRELAQVVASAQKMKQAGEFDGRELERMLSELWNNSTSSLLRELEPVRRVEALYAALRHKGVAFLPWREEDEGLATMEKLLRYWRSPDGGQFEVQRVDLPEGGHVLVATKVERRVYLWLSAVGDQVLETSHTNISNNPGDAGNPLGAEAILASAGYSKEQVERFRKDGMIVRHVFGRDVLGDDSNGYIYVSVLRSKSKGFEDFVEAEGISIEPSRGGYDVHLAQSMPMQRVPQAHHFGFRGEGFKLYSADTGVDDGHPHLPRTEQYDVVNDGKGDSNGHGSHTHSMARGVYGVAPASDGRVGRVFAPNRRGGLDGDIMAAAVDAMRWGADVINLALGSPGEVGSPLAEFFSNLTQRRNSNGASVVVTASAGNDGPFRFTINDPGAGGEVHTGGSSTKAGGVSFFSGVGWALDRRFFMPRYEDKPDNVPIGGDVVTEPGSKDAYPPGHGIEAAKSKDMPETPSDSPSRLSTRESGSSQATAVNAGLDVLILQASRWSLRGAEAAAETAATPGSEAAAFFEGNRAFVSRMISLRTSVDLGVPAWHQGKGAPDAEAAMLMALASFGRKPSGFFGKLAAAARLMSWRAASALGTEGFDWIRRAKALRDLELSIFRDATAAGKSISDRRKSLEASQKAFEARRSASLPQFLTALKDPVWIVRRTAAFSLLNLRAPESLLRPAGAPEELAYLAEAAFDDPDPRVRQVAFEAIAASGRNMTAVNGLLRTAALQAPDLSRGAEEGSRPDTVLYAAYALARLGDGAGVPRLIEGARNPDARIRFTAAALLGELGSRATPAAADALAARVADEGETLNVRHVSVASLAQIAQEAPAAISDEILKILLRNASDRNMALARTIARFFPYAAQRAELVDRLRAPGDLRTSVTNYVLANKGWIGKPGGLGELVPLLARVVDITVETTSPLQDPNGAGVPGVDPERGPLHLIVEVPSDRPRVGEFRDYRDASAADVDAALAAVGLERRKLSRFEGALQATLHASNSLWINVPEHKVVAFKAAMEAEGFIVHRSRPKFRLMHETRALSGAAEVQERSKADGKGALFVLLDEGADLDHPAIGKERVTAARNFTREGSPADVGQESASHGSLSLGIVAARPVDGSPYVGLAPGADLAVAKVLGEYGGSDAAAMAGLEWAVSIAGDPRARPVVIQLGFGGPGEKDSPLGRLVTKLVLNNYGVIAPPGNEGPLEDSVLSPANSPLVVSVTALDKSKGLGAYPSRSTPSKREIRRANYGGAVRLGEENPFEVASLLSTRLAKALKDAATTLLFKGRPLYQHASGTSIAAAHESGQQLLLAGRLSEAMIARFGTLPEGWFLWLNALFDRTAEPLPGRQFHEVGFGRTDPRAADAALDAELASPERARAAAEALMAEARAAHLAAAPSNAFLRAFDALRRAPVPAAGLFDAQLLADAAAKAGSGKKSGPSVRPAVGPRPKRR
ncbi:MAG: S8 family serine peptidase [Elusimicrobia bacterium]|nr:S8 family serine peptidase [Elusimicrobiota bacterium]